MCESVFVVVQIELSERVSSDFDGLYSGDVFVERSEGDIFDHGWAEELIVGVLEEQSESCANGREVGFCFTHFSEYFDGTVVGFEQSEHEVEECGFPRAVWAGESEPLLREELEVEVA